MNSAQYIASQWNIGRELWYREWATLSGGEGQRIALAIGLSLQGTETLLLDGGLVENQRRLRHTDPKYQNLLVHSIKLRQNWWRDM